MTFALRRTCVRVRSLLAAAVVPVACCALAFVPASRLLAQDAMEPGSAATRPAGHTKAPITGPASIPTSMPADKPDQATRADVEVETDAHDAALRPVEEAAAPTTHPATVSPAARAELDQMRDSYKKLAHLKMSGAIAIDFDIDGEKTNKNAAFLSEFVAPNKFRHEIRDELLVGSTGEKLYAYEPGNKTYVMADAPKGRSEVKKLPQPMSELLDRQNPALLLALSDDASAYLCDGVDTVDKAADKQVGAKTFTVLQLKTADGAGIELLVDPASHMLRQIAIDMRKAIQKRGAENVNKAAYTVDYLETKSDGDAAPAPVPEQFAWAPPEGAKEAKPMGDDDEGEKSAASELVGKAAPAFALEDMEGKTVSLADLKGSVVVIDIWATWCPPCRESLPHLDKIYQDVKESGVKVFAVNAQEEKDTVVKFVEATKLKVPVLLDKKGQVSTDYKAEGIPQTVVIGKDGLVKKVFVGFNPKTGEKQLRDAVAQARK